MHWGLHNRTLRTCSVSTATKNKCSVTDVALTCDRLGWWELNKVLVSTCSGTKSWFLRTCRASLSLAGPKCGWITVFASTTGMDITKVKDERISYSRSLNYYQRYAYSQNQNEQANCSMNKYKLVSTKQKNKNKYDMRPLPKSSRLYFFPKKNSELPFPSMRGGGMPLNLATCWRTWEGFSWSLHWLIPDLQENF